MNADRLSSLDAEHIELHITAAAAAGPARALNPQHRVTQLILDQESETRTFGGAETVNYVLTRDVKGIYRELHLIPLILVLVQRSPYYPWFWPGIEDAPLLWDASNHSSWRTRHLHLLENMKKEK